MVLVGMALVAVTLVGSLALLLWRIPQLSRGQRAARVQVEFFRMKIAIEINDREKSVDGQR